MNRQQRRAQRAVLDLAAAEDIARADPHHPLHQRTQHRVQELEQFTSFPDRMVVDFQALGDADFDVYSVNHPARALERPDFVPKVEAVFRGPGDTVAAFPPGTRHHGQ